MPLLSCGFTLFQNESSLKMYVSYQWEFDLHENQVEHLFNGLPRRLILIQAAANSKITSSGAPGGGGGLPYETDGDARRLA